MSALDLTVEGDPNEFTGFFGCPPNCTYNYNNGFYEFGLLDLGSSLAGYTGGSLGADSYVALDTPDLGLGSYPSSDPTDPNSEVAYYLSGTVSPLAATPEPRFYAVFLELLMAGVALLNRRRQHA